jgi:hypothetical protein
MIFKIFSNKFDKGFLITFIYLFIFYYKPGLEISLEKEIQKKLKVVKIDGKEYLFGKINGQVVLTPKK